MKLRKNVTCKLRMFISFLYHSFFCIIFSIIIKCIFDLLFLSDIYDFVKRRTCKKKYRKMQMTPYTCNHKLCLIKHTSIPYIIKLYYNCKNYLKIYIVIRFPHIINCRLKRILFSFLRHWILCTKDRRANVLLCVALLSRCRLAWCIWQSARGQM